jgi:uncharacterized protein (DUF924 family)
MSIFNVYKVNPNKLTSSGLSPASKLGFFRSTVSLREKVCKAVITCALIPFMLSAQNEPPPPQLRQPPLPQGLPQQRMPIPQGAVQPSNQAEPSQDEVNASGTIPAQNPEVPLRAQQILTYWFGSLPSDDYFPSEKMDVWFASSPEIDREMRENFTPDVNAAMRGDLNSWRETPLGRLALILLLDQFPRHIYRNRPQAFASDPMARGLVLEGLQRGEDRFLFPVERAFFYLPLEHSEDLDMQNLSVALYRQLYLRAPPGVRPQMRSFYDYALIHQRQIARFGRFPHRNMIMMRPSTPEELTFLKEGK